MTPDYVAAVAVVGWGVTALWGLNRSLTAREERHGRIVAESRARDRQAPRDLPLTIPKVSLAEKTDRPYGALESDPPGTATTGMLALSAPKPGPEQTGELVLGGLPSFLRDQPPFFDPPPVDDGGIELTPAAFEPVQRALPAPVLPTRN